MTIAYIAGPLEHTGKVGTPQKCKTAYQIEQNIRRAEDLMLELSNMGYAVICVHSQARFMMGECSREHWLEADQELLKVSGIVVLTRGWRSSPGTLAEVALAFDLGKPVFESADHLRMNRKLVDGEA